MCCVCFGTFIAWLSCFRNIQTFLLMLQITVILVLFLLRYNVFNEFIKKLNQLKSSYTSYKTAINQVKNQLYQLDLN